MFYDGGVGRRAGVAAEETRGELLQAAAKVFARRGYEGASISEITSEAGLTSGAVYAHYASKAELFAETVRTHGAEEIDRLLGSAEPSNLLDLLALIGSTLDQRDPEEESLLVAAIQAARDDPEVASLIVAGIVHREGQFADLLRSGQAAGTVVDDVEASSIARLSLMLSLGSLLVGALDLDPPEHDDWARLMERLVGAFRAT
jgi:AcrR family transcriptional regulator